MKRLFSDCPNAAPRAGPARRPSIFHGGGAMTFWRMMICAMAMILPGFACRPLFAAPAKPTAATFATASNPGFVIIKGTSTLHNWSIKAKGLSGTVVFAPPTGKHKSPLLHLTKINLSISVLSLKGSDGSGMDAAIDRKLLATRNPHIIYRLTSAHLTAKAGANQPWYLWQTAGTLTAAGRTRKIDLKLKILPEDGGGIAIETRTKLKMTDFGISPPTAMLGVIRAGNKIKIRVLWNLVPMNAKGK